ncbi:MAG: methyltransferase [Gammaproteobacteria bacterium]|uniref:methyltransferase n=1 Tax=Pseudomaricurvus alcaniphilus TaxID=1166482 RepID=UPI00140997D9|nr:methyltransferase [Pseudomaricurvus alcaniphilus]MBR9910475.1 methyltransferase [Gammaproteobacteria bacterium]NHN39726.1 methyltransferase [Pseudomaricurvus alcaniphilus]
MQQQSFSSWFAELDCLLARYGPLWQVRSFASPEFPWRDSHPELAQRLEELTAPQLDALERNPDRLLQWLRPWVADGPRLLQLATLPLLARRELAIPARLEVGIGGNKWQQICDFVAALPLVQAPTLEWCSGKGHLGRLLAATQASAVTSLEWQAPLCDQGARLAASFGLPQAFVHADVLRPGVAGELDRHPRAMALHACGDLHTTLMRHWATSCSSSLVLSPCCYHLIRDQVYRPMSAQARAAQVRLSRADLSLPLQEVVTAGAAGQRRRRQQLLWRMAFDEWQRASRDRDEYLPLAAIRQSQLSGSFVDFLHWAARSKGLPPPAAAGADHWLERGARRAEQVRRIELVGQMFRRPLEVWLLLDRVLYLQECGATVNLGEFCERRLTPRNAMILAAKSA